MALETVTYITDLVAANPALTDQVAQGRNHIQDIKQALLNCFPNLNGAVSLKPNDFNGVVPIGGCIIWTGAANAIPANWHLADGSTVTRSDNGQAMALPDLRNQFVIGAGSTYTVGQTGGALSVTPTINVDAHTLIQAELPAYDLPVTDDGHTHVATQTPHSHGYQGSYYYINSSGSYAGSAGPQQMQTDTQQPQITVNAATTGITVASGGANQGHTHTAECSVVPTVPPYYALCYIVRY